MSDSEAQPLSEQNLGEIASLDAARVALRWTMERHRNLEEDNRKLKDEIENLKLNRQESESRVETLRKTLESRAKRLEEEEMFYGKLSGTLKLLCEGKVDVNTLIEKQLELEQLQKRLSEEHQKRLLDLEHMQQQVTDRWHQRLLELETNYTQRLNRVRQNFENMRLSQEAANRHHTDSLENFYKEKEQRLEEAKTKSKEDIHKKELELESQWSAKKMVLDAEFRSLKTTLFDQAAQETAQLQVKLAQLMKDNEHWQEAAAHAKVQAHQEFLSKVADYETKLKERAAKIEEREEYLEIHAKELEEDYLKRRRQTEDAHETLKQRFNDRIAGLESASKTKETELIQKWTEDKKLLEGELSAAIQSAADLTGQIHSLQENLLQSSFRKDAEWGKVVESLKIELERTKAQASKQLEEKDSRIGGLQKDSQEANTKRGQEELLMQEEFSNQIRFQQEVFRKKISELEAQFAKKKSDLESEHQRLKTQLLNDANEQRLDIQTQFEQRQKSLETAHSAEIERVKQEAAHAENIVRSLRAEISRLGQALSAAQAQYREDLLKRTRDIEEGYKQRLDELERRESALTANLRSQERALEIERERLYGDLDKRRSELDEMERVLMKRIEDIETQKQDFERQWSRREEELRTRDKRWHDHRHRLETTYSEKSSQIEDLKEELVKQIQTYSKGKKNQEE
ncbi:MAG: hypothetical protein AABZ44_02100 [Elusimicrobiota bacterium]